MICGPLLLVPVSVDAAAPPGRPGFRLPRRVVVSLLGLALIGAGLVWGFSGDRGGPLVVYCAPDAGIAATILRDFEQSTGTPIDVRFATTGGNSPDLVAQIIDEAEAPQCDVFWNAEPLGMLELQERGMLLPYQGPGHARIPAAFKAADGSWTGFAARLRVIVANTARIGTTPPNLDALLPGSDRSKIGFAKPLRGSARTHYTALWQLWGAPRLQAWHHDWKEGGVRECDSNSEVRDLVAEGVCFAGYMDAGDFFAAKADGKPVAMHAARLESGKTIVQPNTVAIIRGTKRKNAARKLVDFLLSAESELALARSTARLVPLGPVSAEQVPAEVRELVAWARDGADLSALGAARGECLAWLKSEYPP